MITRRIFLLTLSALAVPIRLRAAERNYDTKRVSERVPRPADIGPDWHPIHPDRWLVTTSQGVSVFYEFTPPKETGQKKDSVIADIFVLKSAKESSKMIAALRKKVETTKGSILREAPELSKDAFCSHYGPDVHYGQRITFKSANLVLTLSPSHSGMIVAKKLLEALREP